MDAEQRKVYLKNEITKTEKLMENATNDKKYFSLEGRLNFLKSELAAS